MKKVNLVIPTVADLWFRQKCMADPNTMSYNAGYDVSFDGYHYDTGCIDFPEEKWEFWLADKLNDKNSFYAYIQDDETGHFVGYLNYHKSKDNKYYMGIVVYYKFQGQGYMRPAMLKLIEHAKENKVPCLCDTVPTNRERALKVFYDLGFVVTQKLEGKKFGKPEPYVEISLDLTQKPW